MMAKGEHGYDIPVGFYHVALTYEYVYYNNVLFKVCGKEITLRNLFNYWDDAVFLGRRF